MTADELLRETQEVMVINLLDYVGKLETRYGKHMKPPEQGIYLVNSTKPVLCGNRRYYSEKDKEASRPVTQLDGLQEAIVDEDHKVIIPRYVMMRQDKFLKAAPTVPVRALDVATLIIKEWMDSTLMHRPTSDYTSDIMEHFEESGRKYVENGYLEAACERLVRDVAEFVNNRVWSIFFITRRNTDLIIERTCDYRVWDWTRTMEQKTFDELHAREW